MAEKKQGSMVPRAKKTAVQDYLNPSFEKVVIEVSATAPEFTPRAADGFSEVFSTTSTRLPYRVIEKIRCGFKMKLPKAFRAVFSAAPHYASKGLVVVGWNYDEEVEVVVTNLGKELIPINHGDCFAQVTVEPVYSLEWIVTGRG